MSNVRFYRLGALPSFDNTKHVGIFVHATGTTAGSDDYLMGTGVSFNKWLTDNHYTQIPSGLWFGGANGWELLSNDTTSGAIDAAIDAKIQELNVPGYAQATMTINEPTSERKSSTLAIFGIKENNGKISKSETQNFNIAIDGAYNKDTNKIATESTVTTAIEALDVNTVQAVTFNTSNVNGNTTLTFKGIKEVDGRIVQGDEQTPDTFIVGDAKLKIQIGSAAASDVFSANAQADSTIKLDGNVFKKDENNVISVITQTAVASDNRLVTEKDIASLNGAMHYKGTISSKNEFNNKLGDSDVEEAGDVYIATGIPEGSFTDNKGNVIENGDMIVFNGAGEYTVVQSNLTLGTKGGQIAENDGDLNPGYMVIATSAGIKTIGISETDLTGTDNGNNTRTLTYANGEADASDATLFHSTTITDTFKVIGKDFTKTINISSTNRSIEIAKKTVGGVDTGVMVDLVWNTTIE